MTKRRSGAELPSDPAMVRLSFSYEELAQADEVSDTLQAWSVTLSTLDDEEEESPIGWITLYRLCDFTNYSRVLAADEISGDLLRIAETVLEGEVYSAAFEEAVEMPVGDLLILDRVFLDKVWRGFGLGPVFAQEAILRLQGGCCAVACAPGPAERPESGQGWSQEGYDAATAKIAVLWETIGFEPFENGVYLRDTAGDYGEELHARRSELAQMSSEFQSAR
jgi:GNAT superfamily N-acetyltransferase